MKQVTINDVAKVAGVSIATVSAFLTGNRPVAEATSKKVDEAVRTLGYRPNAAAKALRQGQMLRVAYVTPSLINPVFAHLAQELQKNLLNMGYELYIINNEARVDLTNAYCNMLDPSLSGVLMTQTGTCGKLLIDACAKRHIPCVSVLAPDLPNVSCSLGDEEQGARLAVGHLVGYGHTKIGFLMVRGSRVHEERLNGLKAALTEYGFPFSSKSLIQCRSHDDSDAYIHVKERFVAGDMKCSALVCCNDLLAFGACRAAREAGLDVPALLSVTGFDDSIGSFLTPTLTTIAPPKEQMAVTAVHLLMDAIHGHNNIQRVVHPQSLVVRQSTGIQGGIRISE